MKLIGIDYGRRRIGCAVTGDDGFTIRGLPTIDRQKHPDIQYILDIIAREKPEAIVAGVPLNADEQETVMSAEARAFAKGLAKKAGLELFFVDESLTSKEAAGLLRFRKKKDRREKGAHDRLAACLILEAFIAERGSGPGPAGFAEAPE